jgi:hypothetical protein
MLRVQELTRTLFPPSCISFRCFPRDTLETLSLANSHIPSSICYHESLKTFSSPYCSHQPPKIHSNTLVLPSNPCSRYPTHLMNSITVHFDYGVVDETGACHLSPLLAGAALVRQCTACSCLHLSQPRPTRPGKQFEPNVTFKFANRNIVPGLPHIPHFSVPSARKCHLSMRHCAPHLARVSQRRNAAGSPFLYFPSLSRQNSTTARPYVTVPAASGCLSRLVRRTRPSAQVSRYPGALPPHFSMSSF